MSLPRRSDQRIFFVHMAACPGGHVLLFFPGLLFLFNTIIKKIKIKMK